jgi:enamine deaminase RidA (YjgF/YER057c/UK114 family)
MSDIQFLHPKNQFGLPISQAAVAGDYFFTWGYGEDIRDDHVKEDMRKVFEHLKGLLAEKGLTFADVVKVTALLTDTKQWPQYTEVYKEYFKEPFPCRTTIPVVTDKKILEVDLIAYKKGLSGR